MSVEDKIRRAEQIYYRRKNGEIPKNEETRKSDKKDIKLLKKMIYQIIVCVTIYTIFYVIINNNYIFSEDFTKSAKEILSKDINFSKMYTYISDKINQTVNSFQENNQIQEETQEIENVQNNEENIGGAEEVLTQVEESNQQETEQQEQQIEQAPPLSQMEQDANNIKQTVNFIKPLTGTITSIYGPRNPTTASVPKNHTGVDIAAVKGTKIISATDGTVILSSSQGDYGKHLKIQINDVIIVYAHCNKLYVKQGDVIKQGQEIAEVGSTGNTTGPHLHFEVRYQDRYVDPQMILEL